MLRTSSDLTPPPQPLQPMVVAVMVFGLCLLLSAVIIEKIDLARISTDRNNVYTLANDHALTIQNHIDRALSAVYAMEALVQQSHGTVSNFDDVASKMLPNYPGASVLIQAPSGIISHAVPKAGNEKAIGLNLLQDSVMRAETHLARNTGKLTLAGPLPLRQGGIGLVARLPIFLSRTDGSRYFWGFTNVVMKFPQSLDAIGLHKLTARGMNYQLWRINPDNGQTQTIVSSTSTHLTGAVHVSFAVPNGVWNLSVMPQAGWGDMKGLVQKGSLGVFMSFLLAYLAKLQTRQFQHKRDLEQQVAERTADIESSKAQLAATLDAIPDLLFELDSHGVCYACHAPLQHPLSASAEQLLGHSVHDVLPDDAARVVLESLAEAQASGLSNGRQLFLPQQGRGYWFELSVACKKTAASTQEPRFIVISHDITDHRLAQDNVEKLAYFDILTGLPNRALLNERIGHALTESARRREHLCLMFLDLDHFKNINDTLGHTIGDQLLVILAGRMRLTTRDQDTVARFGGDEFIVLLPNTDARGAVRVAEKLLHAISQPVFVGSHELGVTPSIGIAVYPEDGQDADSLSQHADVAMYRAKSRGRNGFQFFTTEMQVKAARTLLLDNELRRALARDQFELHYQPQVSIATNEVVGVEALLRWTHPELGRVSPSEFIPVAESNGLIVSIGEWVLRTAIVQAKVWQTMGLHQMTVAVNLSAVQFRQPHLDAIINDILVQANLPPHLLELELTESVAHQDPLGAVVIMDQLHRRGIRLAIDDFGTGYSSLSYLKRFAAHQIKIDQSFVRDITSDTDDIAIVRAIIRMARSLGLTTIAEGVETVEQLELLRQEGCDEAQGYLVCKPLPAHQLVTFLNSHRVKRTVL